MGEGACILFFICSIFLFLKKKERKKMLAGTGNVVYMDKTLDLLKLLRCPLAHQPSYLHGPSNIFLTTSLRTKCLIRKQSIDKDP